MSKLILNEEAKNLLAKWRPTLSNADDIAIRDLVNNGGKYQKDNIIKLIKLLKKRV